VLKRELRITFLKNLRAMNIHGASLFPGLDGFGQSLKLDLEMKVKA
jgi:PII-like signaling protein